MFFEILDERKEIEYKEIKNIMEKQTIINFLMGELPEYFEDDKIEGTDDTLYIAYHGSKILGFIIMDIRYYSIDIKAVGVIKEFQRKGIGSELIYIASSLAKEKNKKYITGKIKDDKNNKFKEGAWIFFHDTGFRELEKFTIDNKPYLFMVRYIDNIKERREEVKEKDRFSFFRLKK